MQRRMLIWVLLPVFIMPAIILAAGDAEKGKEVYSRCGFCHGDSGEGKETVAKALGAAMKPLGSKEVQALDDAALKKIIIEGQGKMRPNTISDEDAANVIAFLRTLKK